METLTLIDLIWGGFVTIWIAIHTYIHYLEDKIKKLEKGLGE